MSNVEIISEFHEYYGSVDTFCNVWESKTEGDRNQYRKTRKVRKYCQVVNLVNTFYDSLPAYMTHCDNWHHQFQEMKKFKNRLAEDDLLLHTDFAENFECKYGNEIQAIHFGGNRQQITLHTCMLYFGSSKQSYCSIAPDLNHDPITILNLLKPILTLLSNKHFKRLTILTVP